MLAAMVEKASFALAMLLLYSAGRVTPLWLGLGAADGTWLVLFVVAYLRTPRS
jgi:hypothetical protein